MSGGISAWDQLLAVAWLRWRVFVNGFRRRQGTSRGVTGLVGAIVLRVILWPILALWIVGPVLGGGFMAWDCIAHGHPQRLGLLLAGVALLWQFVAVNGTSIAASMPTFDPESLLRYPLRFGRYLLLRTLLGLLTASTVVGFLVLLAAAMGITIARPGLWPAAFAAMGVYALTNLFFARMVGSWMERWLSTRRAREIFGVLMVLVVVGIQVPNLQRGHGHDQHVSWMLTAAQHSEHVVQWLPPGFAANVVVHSGHAAAQGVAMLGLLAWTAMFLWAYAARLHKQFLGEHLSEGVPRSVTATDVRQRRAAAELARATEKPETTLISPTLAACLRKEGMYLRNNGVQWMNLLTPLIFVVILGRGMFARHPAYLLPGSLAYALLGPMAALYNIFGADGAGVQMYLLAPVRLRDVIVAKNIASGALLLVEAVLAWILVMMIAPRPIAAATQVSALLWVVFVVVTNLVLGTVRSVQSPKKIVPGQARQLRQGQAGRTSGLVVLGVMLVCVLLEIGVTMLCRHLHQPWLAAVVFAPLAAAAVGAYALLLKHADALILRSREVFAEELCA